MLTDAALRNLKPKSKIYKASDRYGMYVTVSTSGTIPFRYDYRLNGRLTEGANKEVGVRLEDVFISFVEIRKENWSF